MVRSPDQVRPSRRNSSRRIALPLPATRSPCCDWGLNGGGFSGDRTCADWTAALKLDFDAGPQSLEIVVAKEPQCLREMLGQRNPGSIRQASTRRRLICLRHRRLDACAYWPRRSHRFRRVPHHALTSNVRTRLPRGMWRTLSRTRRSTAPRGSRRARRNERAGKSRCC